MKRASALLPFFLLLACAAAAPVPALGPAPKVEDVASVYPKLWRMTKEAFTISPQFANLCRSSDLRDEVHEKHGEHAFTRIHVFMDDSARQAFKKGGEYPVGAVIVKEKSRPDIRIDHPPTITLGGMIKRKSSSPPSVNDWEFFYAHGPKAFAEEKDLQTCKDCHANAAKKDFVFGDWDKVNQPAGATTKQ